MTRQDAANYRDLIKQPIALKDMKNKTKRNEYKDRAAFRADVQLMVNNAVTYNGPNHWIANIARTLEDFAEQELANKESEVENMECVIKLDMPTTTMF